MVNLTSGLTKSGPFFQNQGIFFLIFETAKRKASPCPPIFAPGNERLLLQNNGVVLLITKEHMQL